MINNIIFKLITINLYKYNLAYSHLSHAIIDHLNSMHDSNFALVNAEIGRQGIHNQLLHHQLHTYNSMHIHNLAQNTAEIGCQGIPYQSIHFHSYTTQ
jgi:hypothetical protein